MNNEQILENTWKNTDKELKKWIKSYKKVNKRTQDRLKAIFDSMNIEFQNINKFISKVQKDRLDRFLLELQEKSLFNDYFGYKARKILNKNKVTYKEMLEVMIEGCYLEENKELDEYNNILFYNVSKDGYERALKDINKPKLKPFTMEIYYALMNMQIFDATAESYMYAMALSNANEMYKNTLTRLQLKKELDIDSKYFQDIILKQQNRYLKIDTMSGGIGTITDNLNNEAYLQAGIENNIKKCRFIAEIDTKTTKMCESLNNQIFKMDDWNEFDRMAGTSQKDLRLTRYRIKELVLGINLPPITSHFHFCRSCITYQLDIDNNSKYKGFNLSSSEKVYINKYISSDSYKINEYLRKNIELPNKYKEMKEELDNALVKLPKYKGTVYRGVNLIKGNDTLKEVLSIFNNKDKIGHWNSYLSSSLDIYDNSFELIFKINSKSGRNLSYFNQEGGGEILFERNVDFKLLKIEKKYGKIIVELDEV